MELLSCAWRLTISFHGLSRNIGAYREATKAIADQREMLVVLPLFDRARFPYGFGDLPQPMSDAAAIRRYLAQPITLVVGTADVLTKDFDMRPAAMRQGATRYERGHNMFNAAREIAQRSGWPFNWRLVEVPDVGHDVRRMYASPQALAALSGD